MDFRYCWLVLFFYLYVLISHTCMRVVCSSRLSLHAGMPGGQFAWNKWRCFCLKLCLDPTFGKSYSQGSDSWVLQSACHLLVQKRRRRRALKKNNEVRRRRQKWKGGGLGDHRWTPVLDICNDQSKAKVFATCCKHNKEAISICNNLQSWSWWWWMCPIPCQ